MFQRKKYTEKFYKDRHDKTLYSANRVIEVLADVLPEITSAIDVGCGVGTWLSVLQSKGVTQVFGVDGYWVNVEDLVIPRGCFLQHDLTCQLDLKRRFDLAISLEVAEHLPTDSAAPFVKQLTKLADFVLFSAAIPGQPGINHINLQWPDYWVSLFKEEEYSVMDIVRPAIWTDNAIPFWYRQNVFLFVKNERLIDVSIEVDKYKNIPLSIVHPEFYLVKTKNTLRNAAVTFLKSLGVIRG